MRRISASVVLATFLVGSILSAVPVAAAEDDGARTNLFMRRDDCGGSADNPRLSLEDGEDVDCGFADNMLSDVYAEVFDPSALFPAVDGIPLTLDGTRPVTGVITIRSWNGAGGGLAELDLTLVGESGAEEKVIGEWATSYQATPTGAYTFEYEMEPQADLNEATFDTLTLKVFTHGLTVGRHGFIEFDEPPATVSIPTAGGGPPVVGPPDDPPPNDPPVKKGCKKNKDKGKKKGCKKGKGPKEEPKAGCAAYVPGEQGAEAETVVVTDEHTEEAPLEATVNHDTGIPETDSSHRFLNVQVDAEAAEAGLYIRYEFPIYEDHDMGVNYADGTQAASVGGFNPVPVPVALGCCDGTGSGGHSEQGAEQLDGLRTADCAGYTLDLSNFLGEGGDYTVQFWLGEIQNDPAPPA